MTTKICRQCAYHRLGDRCGHPSAKRERFIDVVSGEITNYENWACSSQRQYECGKSAKYYRSKSSIFQRIIQFFKKPHEPTQKV